MTSAEHEGLLDAIDALLGDVPVGAEALGEELHELVESRLGEDYRRPTTVRPGKVEG